ncbi:MAG: BrnT family toxin [Deltaproteobacteria bacterium]|nr:BrnT family toxin [Deltaproteobacteria bacterium]
MCHHKHVKPYNWDPNKNEKLKVGRNISFEEIVFHIEQGDEVGAFEHPNQERYPGQQISVVLIGGYAYLVPYVESETEIFLKTIIPSRKATKKHVRE